MIIIDDLREALGRLPQRKLEKAFNCNRSRFGQSRKSIVSPLRWHDIDRSTAPVTAHTFHQHATTGQDDAFRTESVRREPARR